MGEFWDKFVYEFCKVQFLCYEWEINWLGWIVLVVGTLIIVSVILTIAFSNS